MIAYENDAPVATLDFEYPDDGNTELTVTRDRWNAATPQHEKFWRRSRIAAY